MAIPVCPLLSSGNEITMICEQENCAWYMKNYKTCSIYVLAHNAALDIKTKQAAIQQKSN